jgi:hypothetical protein
MIIGLTFLFLKWQLRLLDDEKGPHWVEAGTAAAQREEGGLNHP